MAISDVPYYLVSCFDIKGGVGESSLGSTSSEKIDPRSWIHYDVNVFVHSCQFSFQIVFIPENRQAFSRSKMIACYRQEYLCCAALFFCFYLSYISNLISSIKEMTNKSPHLQFHCRLFIYHYCCENRPCLHSALNDHSHRHYRGKRPKRHNTYIPRRENVSKNAQPTQKKKAAAHKPCVSELWHF